MPALPTQARYLTIEESDRLLDAWEDYLCRLRAGLAMDDYSHVEPPAELSELTLPIARERIDRAAGLLADLNVLEHRLVVVLAQRHATGRYFAATNSPRRTMQAFV